MSYVDEIMKEAQAPEPKIETKAEPQPESRTAEAAPAPSSDEPQTQPEGSSQPQGVQQQPSEQQPQQQSTPGASQGDGNPRTAKDYSSFSPEEKAEFAFKRQLAKQKQKHADELKAFQDSVKKELEEFKASFKKEEPKKTRADFGSDDEYIDYLTEQRVNAIMANRDAEAKKKADEAAAAEAAKAEDEEYRQSYSNTFRENSQREFSTPESYAAFGAKVQKAVDNGLGEVLDQAPAVRDFVFTNPDGALVLDAMLSSKDNFVRVMNNAGNPTLAIIEMHELAKELRAAKNAQPQQQQMDLQQPQQPRGMPHIGKPGSAAGGAAKGIPQTDADIIKFLRAAR